MMENAIRDSDEATDSSALLTREQETEKKTSSTRLNFSDPKERAAHIRAFWEWLPEKLHHASGIDWERLPSPVMGYLIRNIADSPDATALALATGCLIGTVKKRTVASYCSHFTYLLRQLRASYGMQSLADLRSRQIRERFIEGRTPTSGEIRLLLTYDSVAFTHVRTYLEGLDIRQRSLWEEDALPPLPANFTEKHGLTSSQTAAAARHRKEQSDVLLPLFPLLIEKKPYTELGEDYFDQLEKRYIERRSVRRLEQLGYEVTLAPKLVSSPHLRERGFS